VLDARTDFGPDGSGKNYVPRNYDGTFHGLLPMRNTLAMSLNVPAVKVLYLATIDGTIDLAHRMGITTLNDRNRYGLSLVLGGGEVKLLDMTSAFSVFATEGVRNPAESVIKIVDHKGKIYQQQEINSQRVLDVQVARKINSILSDNSARAPIFGSRNSLVIDGKTVAAKTGTTSYFRDAWTVGYTPSIAVGVWAGNNNNKPMHAGADGVFVAAPIWNEYMRNVLADKPNETFVAYDTYKGRQENPKVADAGSVRTKITYYNNKTGKKISEEKARKMDPEKVDKRIEYISGDSNSGSGSTNVALPNVNDPMYKRWVGSKEDSGESKKDKKKKKKD
ncbi:MAG: 1A family penicillin-binding protein, partial [uncultured bacterium]